MRSTQRSGHHARDDLTGEHKIGDAGQLVVLVLFFAAWLTDPIFPEYSTTLNNFMDGYIRVPIGILLLIGAGVLAWKSYQIVFGEVREIPAVIRKGVYNHIRHPMYVSEIILYGGLLLIDMSVIALIILALAIMFFRIICRYEEKLLLERFGEDYRLYMREVPMWVPRIIG